MKNPVPKCKMCEYYKEQRISSDDLSLTRYCSNSLSMIKIDGVKNQVYQFIKLNECKTSPKWCPLRLELVE